MKDYRATVVGFAILLVLMSAGAAQSLSGSNTVDSDDIINGTVASADIKDDSVKAVDIKANAITGSELDAANIVYQTAGVAVPATPNVPVIAAAVCPDGDIAVGGGFTVITGILADIRVHGSYKEGASTWKVSALNAGSESMHVLAYAMCMQDFNPLP